MMDDITKEGGLPLPALPSDDEEDVLIVDTKEDEYEYEEEQRGNLGKVKGNDPEGQQLSLEEEVEGDVESHNEEHDVEHYDQEEEHENKLLSWWNDIAIMKAITICVVGLIAGVVVLIMEDLFEYQAINQTFAIMIWIITLWLVPQMVPLHVTALLPIVLFPLFGTAASREVYGQYANSSIFMFVSAVIMAMTLQRWNVHKRFAYKLMIWLNSGCFCSGAGTTKLQLLQSILLGLCMCLTYILSLFLSNTSATIMMIPVTLVICHCLEEDVINNTEPAADSTEKQEMEEDEDEAGHHKQQVGSGTSSSDAMLLTNPITNSNEKHNKRKQNDVVTHTDNNNNRNNNEDDDKVNSNKNFTIAMLLGIAYTANIGGMSSMYGTGPNLVLLRYLGMFFPDAPADIITFTQWLGFGIPIGLIMCLFVWSYLWFMYLRSNNSTINGLHFRHQYDALGPWSKEQIIVTILFFLEGLLWIFASDLVFGNEQQNGGGGDDAAGSSFTIKGWNTIFPEPRAIDSGGGGTVGILITIILFVFPANMKSNNNIRATTNETGTGTVTGSAEATTTTTTTRSANGHNNKRSSSSSGGGRTTLMDWETCCLLSVNNNNNKSLPLLDGMLILGCGLTLSSVFVSSGAAAWFGQQLLQTSSFMDDDDDENDNNNDSNIALLVFKLVTCTTWLTELTSNSMIANIMLPIAAQLSVEWETNPLLLMISVTLSCSCSFFLPIATTPNLVVFATRQLPLFDMIKAGTFLNVISSAVIMFGVYIIVPGVLDDINDIEDNPDWAQNSPFSAQAAAASP